MKKFKIVLFAILGIYHVITVAVLSYMVINDGNIQFLLDVHGKIAILQWISILCLILFLILLFLYQRKEKEINKIHASYEAEITKLKAKLYDKKEEEHTEKQSEAVPSEEPKDSDPETDQPSDKA